MAVTTRLLQLDSQGTVTRARANSGNVDLGYSAYGLNAVPLASTPLSRFNGQFLESCSGHYLLGNGYRGYNPILMRFNSPDSYSPFGTGGLNGFAYCAGDPVNRSDPSGHMHRIKSSVNGLIANKTGNAKPKAALTGYRRLSEQFESVYPFSAGALANPTAPAFDELSWRGSLSSLASDYAPSAPPVSEFARRHSSASQVSDQVPSAPPVSEFVRRASLESVISAYLPSAPMLEDAADRPLQTGGVQLPKAPTSAVQSSLAVTGQKVREAD
ncbi:RHS repeat-associated core domain-containing protein [Pseudomonas mosselii]|uniref:RHS repeat-associated core domain-containing protein n=1 Tax=Pseudomonas mosselii TaxID=78327 RepID=UPI000D9A9692|nr:hypothetical protein DMX06_18975 [Pseudomonas mosselii]